MITREKANTLLNQLWKQTSSNSTTYYYVGLSTTEPKPDGTNFTEPEIPEGAVDDDGNAITVNEYQRVSMAGCMGDASNGILRNSKKILFFNEAEHYAWGDITHVGIFTSSSGGTPIFWAELTAPVTVSKNYIPIFRVNKFQIGLDNDPANELDGKGNKV